MCEGEDGRTDDLFCGEPVVWAEAASWEALLPKQRALHRINRQYAMATRIRTFSLALLGK